MSEGDPHIRVEHIRVEHIHVERNVVQAGADVRNAMVAMFGTATDPPPVVTTGCGIEVPFAMTSPHPENVTCLTCREYAHREHLRFAAQVEQLRGMPGMSITGEQAAAVVERQRDLAKRFRG